MALVVTDDKHYKNIADTLRMLLPPWSPDEGEDNPVEPDYTVRPSDMWMLIIDCYNDGYDLGFESGMEDGFSEGYSTGHAEGVEEGKAEGREEGYTEGKNEGITEGKQAEYDRFWDVVQNYGNRTSYAFAFSGDMWTQENFKPKYPIRIVGASGNVFAYWGQTGSPIASTLIDFRNVCTLDLSQCTGFDNAFYLNTTISGVGTLDLHNIPKLQNTFAHCRKLQTVEKIILKDDGSQTYHTVFQYCESLVNIAFEGVIGTTGLSLQWSTNLSKASITSVVNALSSTTSGLSVTFSKTAVNNAFTTDEWSVLAATKSNWTINLV